MTPKDEQNARITERQRYLDVLDAKVKLMQTQINLLRQTGELEQWLKAVSVGYLCPGSSNKTLVFGLRCCCRRWNG